MAYREAGPVNRPALLLLHGFPTSSHMFGICMNSKARAVGPGVAPDPAGFGPSDLLFMSKSGPRVHELAKVMALFTELISLHQFAVYVFDYGSPTSLRWRSNAGTGVGHHHAERQRLRRRTE